MFQASSSKILTIIILFLTAGNVYLGFRYLDARQGFNQNQTVLENRQTNENVLTFTKLFIEKVLKAEKEVDFESRLKLENAVRELRDEEILDQWQKFVNSKNESEAQREVKNLLEMLVNKIHPVK